MSESINRRCLQICQARWGYRCTHMECKALTGLDDNRFMKPILRRQLQLVSVILKFEGPLVGKQGRVAIAVGRRQTEGAMNEYGLRYRHWGLCFRHPGIASEPHRARPNIGSSRDGWPSISTPTRTTWRPQGSQSRLFTSQSRTSDAWKIGTDQQYVLQEPQPCRPSGDQLRRLMTQPELCLLPHEDGRLLDVASGDFATLARP